MDSITCRLAFRQVLDATVSSAFEQAILQVSYEEFLMKSQAYNLEQRFTTFRQMVANDPKANSLHYKLGTVVAHFIDQLKHKNPYLYDNLGTPVSFDTCQVKLVESNLMDRAAHKMALIFISRPYELVQSLGDYVLLREVANENPYAEAYETTILIKLQPNLSFFDLSPVEQPDLLTSNFN